jgi:hypothetical protein
MQETVIGDDEQRSMRQKALRPFGLGRDGAGCFVALSPRIYFRYAYSSAPRIRPRRAPSKSFSYFLTSPNGRSDGNAG